MNAMMRHGSRSVIALMLAVSALLVVIGLAVAAASSGGGDDNQSSAGTPMATATAPGATPTLPPEPTATQPARPSPTPSPDSPVTSPTQPAGATPVPSPTPGGAATLPVSNLPQLPAGTQRQDAPIDGLDIAVMESFPPQYLLQIQAGLPSGCAKEAGYEASRSGNVITVKIYNSMPVGPVACTLIYGMYDVNLNLGSDYTSGQTYTVNVNDETITFTAQ